MTTEGQAAEGTTNNDAQAEGAEGAEGTENTEGTEGAEGTEGSKETEGAESAEGTEGKEGTEGAKAPESYELVKPEGSNLEESTLEMIAANASEQGLSQEDAQARVEGAAQYQKADFERVDEIREGWKAESTEKFSKEDMEYAVRAVENFGSPELKEALEKSGFGDHPAWLDAFVKIGKAQADDKLVLTNTGGDKPADEKSDAEIFYGSGSKKD